MENTRVVPVAHLVCDRPQPSGLVDSGRHAHGCKVRCPTACNAAGWWGPQARPISAELHGASGLTSGRARRRMKARGYWAALLYMQGGLVELQAMSVNPTDYREYTGDDTPGDATDCDYNWHVDYWKYTGRDARGDGRDSPVGKDCTQHMNDKKYVKECAMEGDADSVRSELVARQMPPLPCPEVQPAPLDEQLGVHLLKDAPELRGRIGEQVPSTRSPSALGRCRALGRRGLRHACLTMADPRAVFCLHLQRQCRLSDSRELQFQVRVAHCMTDAQAGFDFDPEQDETTHVVARLRRWPSQRLPFLTVADACCLITVSTQHYDVFVLRGDDSADDNGIPES
mmetsp:Transcript_25711/g.85780  ORF Transcript_25711/g.85780 Transcript_25711/m.85780 type:complete len:342 (+) Transcript_25711:208-1233(+)